jgi:hypothetical protein
LPRRHGETEEGKKRIEKKRGRESRVEVSSEFSVLSALKTIGRNSRRF